MILRFGVSAMPCAPKVRGRRTNQPAFISLCAAVIARRSGGSTQLMLASVRLRETGSNRPRAVQQHWPQHGGAE